MPVPVNIISPPARLRALKRARAVSAKRSESRQVSARYAYRAADANQEPVPVEVDVLSPGDQIGAGLRFRKERIRSVDLQSSEPPTMGSLANVKFEVVKKLGSGSYASVYLVREIIETGIKSSNWRRNSMPTIPREFAVKCLSKAHLTPEQLEAQLLEPKLHSSLKMHKNIITLYMTLETSSFLFMFLEYLPGGDLFHWLWNSPNNDTLTKQDTSNLNRVSTINNPIIHNHSSPQRLALISNMFSQMCEAVEWCHAHGVSHRDIKPENFLVHTSTDDEDGSETVNVKLSDFGLSTCQAESTDINCGSAPYMSHECRNKCGPTYLTRAGDTWALGIVLINMLYHRHPFPDTVEGHPEFQRFAQDPVPFLLRTFRGMTLEVALFLATRVFCSEVIRATPGELGRWAKRLPEMLGSSAPLALISEEMSSPASPDLPPISPSWLAPKPRRMQQVQAQAQLSPMPLPAPLPAAEGLMFAPGLGSPRSSMRSFLGPISTNTARSQLPTSLTPKVPPQKKKSGLVPTIKAERYYLS